MFRDGGLVYEFIPIAPDLNALPIYFFPTKSEDNYSGPNSRLHSNPDELGHLPMIFVVVKFEMSTVTEPSSLRSGKLEPETVVEARVCLEDSAIERGSLVGIIRVDNRFGLSDSLSFVRLHRTRIVLIVRSAREEKNCPRQHLEQHRRRRPRTQL